MLRPGRAARITRRGNAYRNWAKFSRIWSSFGRHYPIKKLVLIDITLIATVYAGANIEFARRYFWSPSQVRSRSASWALSMRKRSREITPARSCLEDVEDAADHAPVPGKGPTRLVVRQMRFEARPRSARWPIGIKHGALHAPEARTRRESSNLEDYLVGSPYLEDGSARYILANEIRLLVMHRHNDLGYSLATDTQLKAEPEEQRAEWLANVFDHTLTQPTRRRENYNLFTYSIPMRERHRIKFYSLLQIK